MNTVGAMEYWFFVVLPAAALVLVGTVGYLFKIGLKEKTYEENVAEQKKKYRTTSKPKYTQQKKPVKAPTKEKPNTEKKNKVTFQNLVVKEGKKIEPSVSPSGVDKTDGNANTKKKTEKVQPKNADFAAPNTNEKSQNLNNPVGKITNVESTNNKLVNAIASQEESGNTDVPIKKSNNDKIAENPNALKNDTNNNIPMNKLNTGSDSTDNEDTDSSYNNDRTNSVSYYNSNSANVEKLLNKNKASGTNGTDKKPENEEKQKLAFSETAGSVKTQSQDKKKSKQENDESKKPSSKAEDRQAKEKLKKPEEKSKTPKDSPKDEKAKEKVLASPSKTKKIDDKAKTIEPTVLTNSCSSLNSSPGSEEKEIKAKNDKRIENEKPFNNGVEFAEKRVSESEKENLNSNSSVNSEKIAHKKNNTASPGGKTSPVRNGKSNASKIVKRQATEIKALQKMTNENEGPVNVNLLIPLIAKAELSRTEIQNLIDLLLNKQQEDPGIDAEWIEGSRQDPVVKLKKQLAEKEKLLAAEQDAHQAIQSKLKELRNELNVEKHNNRQLEESLNVRQADFQALNAKLQAALEEKQTFSKQIQQLQSKLNDERMILHSLKEENSKTKTSLQQELLSQRQQLEMHITHLNEQHQQAIVTLESQLGQMAAQLQEQEAANVQMNEELREYALLREQIAVQENQIAHLRQTATATQDLVIQLEELRAIRLELERHLSNSQFEATKLGNDLKSVTEQLNRRNSEIDKFNCTVKNMKIENQELLKENARINEQITNAYSEKKQLQIENEKLTEQLQQLKDQSRKLQEIDQLENELNKYKSFVNEKTTEITELNKQIDELKASLQRSLSLNAELEKQNKVVNEIEDNFKKQLKKNDEIKVKEREELIKRLEGFLPSNVELNSATSVTAEDNAWFDYVEKLLDQVRSSQQKRQQNSSPVEDKQAAPESGKVNMLYELEKQNSKLQSMVSHYKGIISDTEGMLNSLQKHVECEENRWSEQVHVLESKLDVVVKERDLLLNKAKMQNGCLKNEEDEVNEHKLNCDSKHSSILSADYS